MVGAEVNGADYCTSCKGAGGAVSSNEPVSLVTCFYDVQKLRSTCLPSHPCKGRMLDEDVLDDATLIGYRASGYWLKCANLRISVPCAKLLWLWKSLDLRGTPVVAFNIVLL